MHKIEADKTTVQKWLKKRNRVSKQDDDWSFLKSCFDTAVTLRRPFERKWLLTMSFLAGDQYVLYNKTTELLQHIAMSSGNTRVVDNKILPRFQKQVSRLIKTQPEATVVPDTLDEDDIEAAKTGTKFLKHFWRNAQMKGKIRRLAGWMYATGNGFLDDRWDTKKGPVALEEEKLVYQGDVDVGVWSPFEVGGPIVGMMNSSLHELPWIMKMKYRPLEYISGNYEKGESVTPEQRPVGVTDMGTLVGFDGGADLGLVEGATLIELYMKPSVKYPQGLFLAGSNGRILLKDKYPFLDYSLEQFKDIEIPGLFWGMATTEAAIWLQKIQNRTLGDVVTFNRTVARGKYLIPRGSKMEVEPDDTHGQKLLYTPVLGHKPEIMSLKNVPGSYQMALDIVARGLMELYHQHEVTQGTNRSDIRSGDMVQLLQEADDTGNIPTHAIFEESLEKVLHRVLRRVQKGYKQERMIKIVGEGEDWEVAAFQGTDLRNNTDVHVKKESSLPDSRLGRNAKVMERFKDGLYGDPADPEVRRRVQHMLDDAVVQDVYGEQHLDEQNCKLENRAMIENPGAGLPVNDYDDHLVHARGHRRFRKTREYQKVKQGDPKAGLILDSGFQKHMAMHMKFVQEMMKEAEREDKS